MWNCSPWALLPPIFSACAAVGLWAVYFVAVKHENISPLSSQHWKGNGSFYPPYISMAGNFPPASCIFSEVMNLAAFVGFIIAVLRYLQLKHVIDKPWLNVGSLVLFSIGCFGMTLIGNFQLLTEKAIHNAGTFMTFGLGTVYCWVQSYMTLKANLKNEGRKVAIVRFLLSASITLCMVLHFTLISQRLHMDAARCQWALVMFFLIFLSTFATEFRHNRFDIACTENCGHPVSLSETHSEVPTHPPDQL